VQGQTGHRKARKQKMFEKNRSRPDTLQSDAEYVFWGKYGKKNMKNNNLYYWGNLKILKKHSFIFVILTIFLVGTPYIVYSSEKKSVAIATFQNLTKDKEIDWIGTGFAETLTTKLINVKSIRVFERNQMAKLLEEIKLSMTGIIDEKTATQAGKFIGVEYMVIGSFQKVNERIMVTARLVNVATSEVERSASVKGNYKDLFELQEELTLKLATILEAPISEEEKINIAKPPAKTLSAYEWFAKGKNYVEEAPWSLDDLYQALSCFNKAIELEPGYMETYFFRGWVFLYLIDHYQRYSYSNEGKDVPFTMSLYDKAIEDFTRIIELHPGFEEPYYAQHYTGRGDAYADKGLYDLAIEDYTKVIELERDLIGTPGFRADRSYLDRGDAYAKKGLYDEAISDYTRAIELCPVRGAYLDRRGWVYMKKGLYDEAIEDFTRLIELFPKSSIEYYCRGEAYRQKGLHELAITDYKKAVDLGDYNSVRSLKEFYNIDYEKK